MNCPSDNHLVMVLHQLYNDFNLSVEVFNGDDSHDVGSILLIWVFTILIGQNKAGIRRFNLQNAPDFIVVFREFYDRQSQLASTCEKLSLYFIHQFSSLNSIPLLMLGPLWILLLNSNIYDCAV